MTVVALDSVPLAQFFCVCCVAKAAQADLFLMLCFSQLGGREEPASACCDEIVTDQNSKDRSTLDGVSDAGIMKTINV